MAKWVKTHPGEPSAVDRVSTDTTPDGLYSDLRHQALTVKRAEVGIPAPPAEAPVWGVLMETGFERATATLLALADSTTSLYISNGGGVIGGHGHETVREANVRFIQEANNSLQNLQRCEDFPIPAVGRTIFYALTDAGILTGGALENDLGYRRHQLSSLFHAGHDVITQLRLISEDADDDA